MFILTMTYTDDKLVYETKNNVVQIFDLLCKHVNIDLTKINIIYVAEDGKRYGITTKFNPGVYDPNKIFITRCVLRFLRIIIHEHKVYQLTPEQQKTLCQDIKACLKSNNLS